MVYKQEVTKKLKQCKMLEYKETDFSYSMLNQSIRFKFYYFLMLLFKDVAFNVAVLMLLFMFLLDHKRILPLLLPQDS